MGDGGGGYIQTGSRRGSFVREGSFKEWTTTSTSGGSSSRAYSSQMNIREGVITGLSGSAQTGDGNPGLEFDWRNEEGSNRENTFESSSSFQRQELMVGDGTRQARMGRMGYVGAVSNFSSTNAANPRDLPLPQRPPYSSFALTGSGSYSQQSSDRESASDIIGGNDYTVTSPKSVRSASNIPISLDEMIQAEGPSRLTIENVGSAHDTGPQASEVPQITNGWTSRNRSAPIIQTRPGWGSSLHGSPRSQLSPVMEVADCPSPVERGLGGSRQPLALESNVPFKVDSGRGREEGPDAGSDDGVKDIFQLSQFPLGPNVSSHTDPGGPSSRTWNGRSIDTTVVAAPTRAVREQYIIKLRGAGEQLLRIGRFCVKNVWFWVALVGVIAGVEGFNEERRNKPLIADETWWSDEEEEEEEE